MADVQQKQQQNAVNQAAPPQQKIHPNTPDIPPHPHPEDTVNITIEHPIEPTSWAIQIVTGITVTVVAAIIVAWMFGGKRKKS